MSNGKKVLRLVSQILLVSIVIVCTFLLLINFDVISFSSSGKPEVINLNQNEVGIKVGEHYQLIATIEPSGVHFGDLVWSSDDPSIATVNKDSGYVTAKGVGDVIIRATIKANNLESECLVHVSTKDIIVTKLNISNDSINLLTGKTYTIKYSVSPKNVTVHNFEYHSSDTSVAKVDSKGVITAVKPGKAVIKMTARNGNVSDKVTVNVYSKTSSSKTTTTTKTTTSKGDSVDNSKITSISLSKTSVNLSIGGTQKIIATVLPNSANQSVTWTSSNTGVAKVDSNGKITGVGAGNCNIVCEAINGKTAVVKVKVGSSNLKVSSISMKDTLNLSLGDDYQLDVKFTPSNATNQNLSWTSSNEKVLKVDGNGNIQTLSKGSSVVTATATDGGAKAYCTVFVEEPKNIIPETSISFSKTSYELAKGKSITLTPIISPNNATYKKVKWSTSDRNVVTVDDGLVYANEAGTATITATTEYKKIVASVTFTVKAVKVTSLTLNDTNISLELGKTKALYAVVLPSDASNKKVDWTVADKNIVSVDSYGIITGLNKGKTTITATSKDNSSIKATAIVEVK